MNYFILDHELRVRLFSFLAIFVGMALWELAAPKRPLLASKGSRWLNNLVLVTIGTGALRLLIPATAMTAASSAVRHQWGLINVLGVPGWPAIILGVAALDLAIYFQHVMFHGVPAFWRLHMVHHTDLDIDVTTGVRFHPLEVILSMGIKIVVVVFLGIPVLAVLIFEVLLNGTSMFNHGNVSILRGFDGWLRLLVVTPDTHRVHHSVIVGERNSNFGFNFPWWDRLFGTYRAQPSEGHTGMTIGLARFRDSRRLTLSRLLVLPFLPDRREKSPTG
jgi:sterol desaturase/sphingolipid hydroxylase (fatty acid hydroxylase superfamily)